MTEVYDEEYWNADVRRDERWIIPVSVHDNREAA